MKTVFVGRNIVLCMCENSVPSLMGYISLMLNGQVPLLLEGSQPVSSAAALVAAYRPSYLWLDEERCCEFNEATVVYRFGHYVMLRTSWANSPPAINEQLQLLLNTSGSTGSSKMVRLSKANLMANAAAIISYLDIRECDVAVTILPFSYSFGLSIVHTHLLVGASIQVTMLTPLSRQFWMLVQQRRVTSLSGVPYTYDMLNRIKFERFDLPAIRYLTQAGGKMSQQGLSYLKRLSAEKGWRCFVMYGQTEASARMSYLPPEWLERKLGSIGNAIPKGRFEIVDADGHLIVDPKVPGEIVYYGENVALGYASGTGDLALGDEWVGRLPTGDLAYRDEDGFYYIVGRIKRFVKIFGNRVSLDEVETLLQGAYPCCEFFCYGQDDRLCIACVGQAERDSLLAFVTRQLSIHHSAIRCDFIAEIPRLANGKVDYNALNPKNSC